MGSFCKIDFGHLIKTAIPAIFLDNPKHGVASYLQSQQLIIPTDSMEAMIMKLKGIPGIDSVPSYQSVFNMPAMHFFKIKKGKIYDIEATGLILPYGTKTGWE
jgi:hypothetical protein